MTAADPGPDSGSPAGDSGSRPVTAARRALGPPDPASGWVWVIFGVVGFVGGQFLALILLAVVANVSGHGADYLQLAQRSVPPGWVVVTELLGLWGGFVGAAVLASRTRGSRNLVADMGLRFRPIDFLVGPVVGLFGQLVLIPLLYLPLQHTVPNFNQRMAEPATHLTGGFPGADLAVIGALTVMVVPVVEELLFRGVFLLGVLAVLRRSPPRIGAPVACVASGIVFGLAHFEALQLLGLAAFGTLLAVLAYRTGRLGPSILAHGAFNLVAIVAVARVGPWW